MEKRSAGTPAFGIESQALLREALTHRSVGTPNNERLEFLGDGLLDFVVAEALFSRFPQEPEGSLSRLRASLVCQDTLARLAKEIGLADHLRLGEGELRSGGYNRPSILADSLEAILGAIYLDQGFQAARTYILGLFQPLLAGLEPGERCKDPKTRLQEWLQGRKKALPKYVVLETTGAAHEKRFEVACEIESPSLRTTGFGPSRRAAEQQAAENALKVLES